MAVTGLANLAVKVSDLEGACAWYEAAGFTTDAMNEFSKLVAAQTRASDAVVGELTTVRQLTWSARDQSGRECPVGRPVASS